MLEVHRTQNHFSLMLVRPTQLKKYPTSRTVWYLQFGLLSAKISHEKKCFCFCTLCEFRYLVVCMDLYKHFRKLMANVGRLKLRSVIRPWPTSRAIDPAPGAWFIAKFISFTQVVSGPV